MSKLDEALEQTLKTRRDRGLLRSLAFENEHYKNQHMIDFSSNDYLGFARSEELEESVTKSLQDLRKQSKCNTLGSTGSRLLTGDSQYCQELEQYLAKFHNTEAALIFNSGFDANLSLMSCLPQPNSIVLFDELVHNSCREGIKLCRASITKAFKHNDVEDLQKCLKEAPNDSMVIIVIESVYSMDGHIAPLKAFLDVAEHHGNAFMVVDEAHGTGVYGRGGRGLTQQLDEQKRVFARVHTFGKALGSHGAVIVGSSTLKSYLCNYARPLIYSTSLPMHSLVAIRCAYELMEKLADERQQHLESMITKFREHAKKLAIQIADSPSPIQAIMISGNENVLNVALEVQRAGFRVFPIRSPTVPTGEERLRVVLHDFNTSEEITTLVDTIANVMSKVGIEPTAKRICV
jgi:8-amino-7-oxononanoate synthase